MIPETHTVQRGDTLTAIARHYGVSNDDIARANHLPDVDRIVVGQVLQIPRPAWLQPGQGKDAPWSETQLRFVDSIDRPIAGLVVRLVAGSTEVHGRTDASGYAPKVHSKTANDTIAIHVQRHAARGGGEKQIASYSPAPGKQTVRLQSGLHVETTKLRRHTGSPEKPPRRMPPSASGTQFETRTRQGNPLTCSVGCECPNGDELKLGPNNLYRDWVKQAAQRAGLMPQAVAAVMNAEASKGKGGQWKADSKSPKSSATGMTQFIDATWIGVAVSNGTHLNGRARQAGWLIQNGQGEWCFIKANGAHVTGPGLERKLVKLLTHRRTTSDRNLQRLLDLREDPECAIMAAMDYAKANLAQLRAKGYAVDRLNDVEKARIMYLCHHLGLGDAERFIQNTIPEEDDVGTSAKGKKVVRQNGAKKLLITQVGKVDAIQKYVNPNGGNWVKGHRAWLNGFVNRTIIPSVFACAGEKQNLLHVEEIRSPLLKIAEKLKK